MIKVQDFREGEYVDRELVLVKVAVDSKTRAEVMQITDIFRAKIVDVQPKSLTIEITGDESKVEKLLEPDEDVRHHGADAHGQGGAAAQVARSLVTLTGGESRVSMTGTTNQTDNTIMAIINFGGTKEKVITRKEFPMAKARKVLKNETIAIIGYGVQGPAQSLNLRDNGFKVIIGQASAFKRDWDRAVKDGWVPGKTLFEIEEAVRRGTIIQMLVSDAAQRAIWPMVKKNLKPGDALYFSHGFSIAYRKQTGVVPPKNVDVIMVAPKGSGTSVRRNFLTGAGINSSFAVEQDATGRAKERCLAVGIGIGSGYLFPTTFQHEVFSDLTGERGVLMGALAGIMEAQYDVLRAHKPLARARRSTRPSRNSRRASSAWWTRTAWTGCIRTAPPPPSAARWTGSRGSRRPCCRCSRNSMSA